MCYSVSRGDPGELGAMIVLVSIALWWDVKCMKVSAKRAWGMSVPGREISSDKVTLGAQPECSEEWISVGKCIMYVEGVRMGRRTWWWAVLVGRF
jgi:hypothetical protein